MESSPYGGRILWPIVRSNLDVNIEGREYAIRVFSGHTFGREALLSGGGANNEAGVPAGGKDNFVLPLSTVVPPFGVGKMSVQTDENGRAWTGWGLSLPSGSWFRWVVA